MKLRAIANLPTIYDERHVGQGSRNRHYCDDTIGSPDGNSDLFLRSLTFKY